MYWANEAQRLRKLSYTRFRSLSERGYSIEEETASSTLFAINTDPFGRTFFSKSLGEVVVRDPLTGRSFTQEEWATKEFVVDNKCQLVNKVSADLVVGKRLSIKFREEDREEPSELVGEEKRSEISSLRPGGQTTVSDELDDWLQRFVRRNRLPTVLYESALQNSSLGDQYFALEVEGGGIDVVPVDPFFVEILEHRGRVVGYEVAWDIEQDVVAEPSILGRIGQVRRRSRRDLVMKKFYFPGYIRWELFEIDRERLKRLPLWELPENRELLARAFSPDAEHLVPMIVGPEDETGEPGERPAEDERQIGEVIALMEYTGIDVPTLVHWPNYRMFSRYGMSDNGMIESLQNALNNRETQLNDVLDKHADPAMAGPDAYLDENGNLPMSGGGGRYFPVGQGDDNPEYLEWGGHLQDSHREIERLYRAILANTETAAALLGMDEGGVQSGRALMYKLLRSLAMATRKATYMTQAIIDLTTIAQKLRLTWLVPEQPSVTAESEIPSSEDWRQVVFEPAVSVESAIPEDREGLISEVERLVEQRIITRATAVRIIERLYDEVDAESEEQALESEDEVRRSEALSAFET